jgi:hypothetical protein
MRKIRNKTIFVYLAITVFIVIFFFLSFFQERKLLSSVNVNFNLETDKNLDIIENKNNQEVLEEELVSMPIININKSDSNIEFSQTVYIDSVPFTPQAPLANWQDQRQQDGCEEASALMAVKWARGEKLNKTESLKYITEISDYLLNKYGEYRDISATDTITWIFNDYFSYDKVSLKKDITIDQIIYELNQGNLVLAPMNGQIMNNPYFTPPGPSRHMILIHGYDDENNLFITHDPGTKYGKNYQYDQESLFEAIRDYPTGYHELIKVIEKNVIIVEK